MKTCAQGAGAPSRRVARVVFGTCVGLLLIGAIEGAARLAYAYRDHLKPLVPTPRLQDYHVVSDRAAGHWTLQPGYLQTVSGAMEAKQAAGRVLGAERIASGVERQQLALEDIYIQINSDGYRGPEIDRTHSRPRILTVGDSCTFGLAEAHTYPRALQSELESRGKAVEVINGGVEGYSARNVLLRMEDYTQLQPEIVTLYIGWNSLLYDEADVFGALVTERFYAARLLRVATGLAQRAVQGDRAAALAAVRREPRVDPDDPLLARAGRVVPAFTRQVSEIARQFRNAGSRVYLITLPGLFTMSAPPSQEALRIGHLPLYTANPLVLARLTANYNDALRALAANEGYGLIDLDRWSHTALVPRERYFFDSVHVHEEGLRLIGRELANELEDKLGVFPRRRAGS